MKISRQPIAFVAALALPFTLSAQTTGGSDVSMRSDHTTDTRTGGQNSMRAKPSDTGASTGSANAASPATTPGTGETAVQRVTKDSLDEQLTAKDLLDKDVYDRNQNKIGKIVDVVLTDQSTPLAFAFSESEKHGSSSTSVSNATGTDSASAGNTTRGNRGLDSSLTGSSSSGSSPGTSATSQMAVVIAHGGMLKRGKDLIRAPLSKLNYDSNQKHLTLSMSTDELQALVSANTTGR